MRIAALYDIHGNLPALEAALKETEQSGADEILVGGDVIIGPMSSACLDLLFNIKKPVHYILGNCEVAVLDHITGITNTQFPENIQKCIDWTAKNLRIDQVEAISSWPEKTSIEIDNLGHVLFCHATPESTTDVFTKITPESKLIDNFNSVDESIVVCGHTHMQFEKIISRTSVLNAGSVGMPFGLPGAYWLLLSNKIDFRKTLYDFNHAASLVKKTKYPDAYIFALKNILHPPSENSMLEILER